MTERRKMGQIPEDATHWDTGDWITWHRTGPGLDQNDSVEASPEPLARLAALHVSLLRAAKGYFEMTGHHLPVYREIAYTHAAIHCDLPFEGPDRTCESTGVEVLWLEPHGPSNLVNVDLNQPFATLIVVRIKDNFKSEARMIQRAALPDSHDGPYPLSWTALPHQL